MIAELFSVLALVATAPAASDELAPRLAAAEARYRESLVEIRYRQHVRVSTTEPPQEEELTTTGLVVSDDGLVMVSSLVYEPFNQVPHGIGIRFPASVSRVEAEVAEARARFADGSEYEAVLVGRDPEADVAFFRIDAPSRTFRPVEFDAGVEPSLGAPVLVLSLLPEPLGPALAVELSRIQAVVDRPTRGFLVATSAADPVGSLVVDLDGRPVGMADALTVPIPERRPTSPMSFFSVFRDLSKGVGRAFARPAARFAGAAAGPPVEITLRRGWLGVEMQALTPELAEHMGLPVDAGLLLGYVYRDSPAERAGLRVGDVLVELDGEPIGVRREEDIGSFAEKVLRAGAGAALRLGYLRDGEKRTTVATLAPAPKTAREAEAVEVPELDLVVREVTFDYLAARNLEPGTKGVVVEDPPVAVRTNPRRVASGDLLVKINDYEIADLDAFRRVVEILRREKPDEVVLFVERGRESFFFAIKPEWD